MGFHKKNQDQNRIHNLEFTTNRKQKIPLYLKNLEWKQNSLSIIPDRENTMAVWKFDRMWRKKQCSEKKKTLKRTNMENQPIPSCIHQVKKEILSGHGQELQYT